MGRIKHTEVAVNEIVGNAAADSWSEAYDQIEDLKEQAREDIRAQVEEYLDSQDIDVDDWESVMDEDLNDFIDEYIYSEWEV